MLKKSLFLFVSLFFVISFAKADECCPDDPDFDAGNCATNGGTLLAPGCGGGGPGPGAAGIPLDGGASIFALGAAIYGIRRMRKK